MCKELTDDKQQMGKIQPAVGMDGRARLLSKTLMTMEVGHNGRDKEPDSSIHLVDAVLYINGSEIL